MVKVQNDNFSIAQICQSGQCFRMYPVDNPDNSAEERYSVTAYGRYLELFQNKNEIYFDCTQQEYDDIWKSYFDMDTDYAGIIAGVDRTDVYLVSASEFGQGIRILRQDLWEMIISFIVSQQNNIKRIRKIINLLCERYGECKSTIDGRTYYDFPTPESLARATIEELYECNLGYRSRYIYQTANAIRNKEVDLDEIAKMDYPSAREELLKLSGVGAKVADCICLFALHKTQAFPIDTHIKKVLERYYANGFPFEQYGDASGILQQYIFYYDLNVKPV